MTTRVRLTYTLGATVHKKACALFALLFMVLPLLNALPQEAFAAPTPSLIFSDGHAFIVVSYNGNSAKFAEGPTGGGTAPVKYGNPITKVSGSGCTGTITVPQSTFQAGAGSATLNNVKCGSQTFNGSYSIATQGTAPGTPASSSQLKINWSDVKSAVLSSDGTQITITFNDGSEVVFYNQNPPSSKTYQPQPIESSNLPLDGVNISGWCPNTQSTPSQPNSSGKGVTVSGFGSKTATGAVDVCYEVGSQAVNQSVKISVNTSAYDPGGGGSTTPTPSCENNNFALSWLFCKIIEGTSEALDEMYSSLIQPLLGVNPISLSNSSGDKTKTYAIWSNFRIYGDIFLVLALLVMVFGESIGGGLVDAYTVKKVLPRLVAAAILINLSIYIVALAVDITNILGKGLEALIEEPFKNAGAFKINISAASGTLGFVALVGVAGTGAIWAAAFTGAFLEFILLFILVPTLLAFVAILVVLLVRRGLILFLVLISPIAFALYCLPNTEKYFKQWWSLLVKTLLMYPIIAVIFAIANIMSVTINSTTTGIGKGLGDLLSLTALVVPLFLIPFSFRLAGGVMGQFAGLVNDRKNRLSQPLNRLRSARMQKFRQEASTRAKTQDFFRKAEKNSLRGKFDKGIAGASNIGAIGKSGFSKKGMKADIKASVSANRNIARLQGAKNSKAFQLFGGNDTMLEAAGLMYTEGETAARSHLSEAGIKGEQQDRVISLIKQGQKEMGAQNLALTAAVSLPATGTGVAEGPGQLYDLLDKAGGGDMDLIIAAYAESRDNALRGRRTDIIEDFGQAVGHIQEIHNADPADREAVIQRINQDAADSALDTQGVGSIVGARPEAVVHLSAAMQRRTQKTFEKVNDVRKGDPLTVQRYNEAEQKWNDVEIRGEEAVAEAERQFIQAHAENSVALDYAGSAAPQIQRMLANTVHNGNVTIGALPQSIQNYMVREVQQVKKDEHGNPMFRDLYGKEPIMETVKVQPDKDQLISNSELYTILENSKEYQQMKKVYAQQFAADRAGADAATAAEALKPPGS